MAYPYSLPELSLIRANRSRMIMGNPSTVKAQLDELVEKTWADELMVTTNIYGHAERVRSYELLAEAFD
jgi:alkanesulfonate monooxygenase SsuD/methylene tetrahydromethanopterin reductase-like flavin-dependent oxidoreductase (luciferase family)